jgi:transposase
MPKGKIYKKYTAEFKQMVVEYMRKKGLSLRETKRKFEIGDHNIIARWESIYLEEGIQGLRIERRGSAMGSKKGRPPKFDKKVEEDLVTENQRLRMEIEYLKKLNALVHQQEQVKNKKHR